MLTMLPDFCRNICFTASCDTYKKPARVVETRVLKSSVVYSVKGFGIKTPALLTSTSIRPNRDTAVSTIFAAVRGSPMSPSTSATFAAVENGFTLVIFREFASQVRIPARLICKGVEDAELSRPEFDRVPFQGRFFVLRERLSRL